MIKPQQTTPTVFHVINGKFGHVVNEKISPSCPFIRASPSIRHLKRIFKNQAEHLTSGFGRLRLFLGKQILFSFKDPKQASMKTLRRKTFLNKFLKYDVRRCRVIEAAT